MKGVVKGQLSAEMVILLVVVIAVIAIVASNLFKGAKTASHGFENKVSNMTANMNQTCFTDMDCPSGQSCVDGRCQ